ncbi:MAG TPA: protein kinase [Polyangiales bacterium]|nr:protein kinase [Polyangiales bacterium]
MRRAREAFVFHSEHCSIVSALLELPLETRAVRPVDEDAFVRAEDWFFTMELVDGKSFDQWVRPRAAELDSGVVDEARLRAALAQLCDAITAIHEAGKLHRDLKPSYVLVTPEGRVVVLDFGLAIDPQPGGVGQTLQDAGVSGTPAYVRPNRRPASLQRRRVTSRHSE